MAVTLSKVRLLNADPDLGAFLSSEERRLAERVVVLVQTVEVGDVDFDDLLADAHAFGAIVLEGMLLRRMLIGEQSALRLLGPGDMVTVAGSPRSALLVEGGYRATARTELAILDEHALAAIRRFPQLAAGLHVRMADQQERLTTQLAICQLPRVEDRVLAIMWLLAESFGRVTSSGTTLPLALTHDALGELIGAKRPTVTLALKELSDRGALVRQDRGWLLLEQLSRNGVQTPLNHEPVVIDDSVSSWEDRLVSLDGFDASASLLETVHRLREDHARNAARVAAHFENAAEARERSRQIRAQIMQRRRPPKPAPS